MGVNDLISLLIFAVLARVVMLRTDPTVTLAIFLPLAGVVYAPQLDETYTAVAGRGARLDGFSIHASSCDRIEEMPATR